MRALPLLFGASTLVQSLAALQVCLLPPAIQQQRCASATAAFFLGGNHKCLPYLLRAVRRYLQHVNAVLGEEA
jgi:hypothetical protein